MTRQTRREITDEVRNEVGLAVSALAARLSGRTPVTCEYCQDDALTHSGPGHAGEDHTDHCPAVVTVLIDTTRAEAMLDRQAEFGQDLSDYADAAQILVGEGVLAVVCGGHEDRAIERNPDATLRLSIAHRFDRAPALGDDVEYGTLGYHWL